jgi:hypothetical protein
VRTSRTSPPAITRSKSQSKVRWDEAYSGSSHFFRYLPLGDANEDILGTFSESKTARREPNQSRGS